MIDLVMALNAAHQNDGLLIYDEEHVIKKQEGVSLKFKGNNLPKEMQHEANGSMYLTQYRMIFLSEKCKPPLRSFAFPFHSVKGLEIEQPIFKANYLKGKVNADPDGGFFGTASFEISFRSGGAIEYAQLVIYTATECNRKPQWQPAGPPSYWDIYGSAGAGYSYPAPGMTVSGGSNVGFVPMAAPSAPPSYSSINHGSAYVPENPPSYAEVEEKKIN